MQLTALRAIIAVLALIPVAAGGAGVVLGPAFVDVGAPWPADLDSHLRFLSGVFLVLGLGWWSCIPRLPERGARLRLLAAMTFGGGLARLWSLGLAGLPSAGHVAGLVMELVIVPLLVAWHARIVGTKRRT